MGKRGNGGNWYPFYFPLKQIEMIAISRARPELVSDKGDYRIQTTKDMQPCTNGAI